MTEREALLRLASIISEMATDLGLCHYSDEAETVERAFLYDEQPADKPEEIPEKPCDHGNIAGEKGEEEIAPCPLCGSEMVVWPTMLDEGWSADCHRCNLQTDLFETEAELLAYLNGSWMDEPPAQSCKRSGPICARGTCNKCLYGAPAPNDALKAAYQKGRAMVSEPAPMEPLGRDFEKVWEDNLDALYEADPAPEPQQEPVAWTCLTTLEYLRAGEVVCISPSRSGLDAVPLYTHPAPLGAGEPTEAQVDAAREAYAVDGENLSRRSMRRALSAWRKVLGGEA